MSDQELTKMGEAIARSIKAHQRSQEAMRLLYNIVRELTDDGVVDLDVMRADGIALADAITFALAFAEVPMTETFGQASVK